MGSKEGSKAKLVAFPILKSVSMFLRINVKWLNDPPRPPRQRWPGFRSRGERRFQEGMAIWGSAASVALSVTASPFAYVTSGGNNVSVIDTATNMVVATVPTGDDPEGWPSPLTGNKPVTLRTLATPDALGLKTLNELARRLGLKIWINRKSVTRLAKAARPVRFGDACPSWQRRISTDCAPSPGKSSIRGRRYREELPAR